MSKRLSSWQAWGLFIILAIVWGSSFILMKKGLASFSYTQIGLLRIALAAWFTLLLGYKHLNKLTKQNAFPLLMVGLFGNAIPYLLFPLAVTKLDSSLVGILNALVPLFSLIIGLIWFKIEVRWPSVTGVIIGLAGAVWLLMPGMEIDQTKLAYGLYPILATICYAISINVINSKLTNVGSLGITLISLMFVGVPATVYLLVTGFIETMQTEPKAWESLGYIAILAVIGTSLAIIIFTYLLKQTSSLFAASVTYAIPIVALIWGVIDGEAVGWEHLFGMLAILLGVYLVNLRGSLADRIKRKKRRGSLKKLKL